MHGKPLYFILSIGFIVALGTWLLPAPYFIPRWLVAVVVTLYVAPLIIAGALLWRVWRYSSTLTKKQKWTSLVLGLTMLAFFGGFLSQHVVYGKAPSAAPSAEMR